MKLMGYIRCAGNLVGNVSERSASGNGPLVVRAGTEEEQVQVTVMPSGDYTIEIVKPHPVVDVVRANRRFKIPGGSVYREHTYRKRITGQLRGGNGNV